MFLTTCRHYFHIWLLYSFFSKLNVAKLNYGRQKVIYFVCVSACTTGKLSVTSKHKKFTKCNVSVSEILLFGKVSPAKFPVLPIYRMDNAIFFLFRLNVECAERSCTDKCMLLLCVMNKNHIFSVSNALLPWFLSLVSLFIRSVSHNVCTNMVNIPPIFVSSYSNSFSGELCNMAKWQNG